MYLATATRTMAGAKQFVRDEPVCHQRAPATRSPLALFTRERQAEKARQQAIWRKMELQLELLRSQPKPVVQKPRWAIIIEQVAAWHNFTAADILGACREKSLVAARFDAIAAVYLNCTIEGRSMSTGELGRMFRRDHTSALNALRQRGIIRNGDTNGSRYPISIQRSDKQ